MPYIPPKNRPAIDEKVDVLAEELAESMVAANQTAEVSTHYREAFMEVANWIASVESGVSSPPETAAQKLGAMIIEKAAGYEQTGAWTGELNYAITILIQVVPIKMYRKGAWSEPLRYWLYAQTVGALTRTAYELHAKMQNDYVGNGLAGVFEDIKDEYKRRVNTAYEAAQINKSGDCYDYVPYRTQLTPFAVGDVEGFIEIQLPRQEPK
jgi:hypothetical protein